MGLYVSGKRLSDITTETGWAGSDILTGLKSGDNKNITITELTAMVIDNVDTVDPLPPGTYAKVMYKGPVSWGASSLFVTDGSIVGIGLTEPSGGHQLEIKYNGTAQNLLNIYKNDISDAQIKGLAYSNTGILFLSDSGIPANIDSDSNANTYSSYFQRGIIANDDVFLNIDNNSALKFGSFNVLNGAFSENGFINMPNPDLLQLRANEFVLQNSLAEYLKTTRSVDTEVIRFLGDMSIMKDDANGCTKIRSGVSGGYPDQSLIGAEPMLRIAAKGSSPAVQFQTSLGVNILKLNSDGTVELPLYAAATSGQLCVDGEIVKKKA